MAAKKNRIELVFGVRDKDLFDWMVENELNSSTAIKNILRAQMALYGNENIIPSKAKKTEVVEVKKPEKKVGLAGINYKKM